MSQPTIDPGWEIVFGYRDVSDWPGFPPCPCLDPGTYVALERKGDDYRLLCWCGRRGDIRWDSTDELMEFLARYSDSPHMRPAR